MNRESNESLASQSRNLLVFRLSENDIDIESGGANPSIDNLLDKHQYTKWAFFVLFHNLKEISNGEINSRMLNNILSEGKISQFSFYKGTGVKKGESVYGLLVFGITSIEALSCSINLADKVIVGTKGSKAESIPYDSIEEFAEYFGKEYSKLNTQERSTLYLKYIKEYESLNVLLQDWWDKRKEAINQNFSDMSDHERLALFKQRAESKEPTEYDTLLMNWWLAKEDEAEKEFLKMSDQQRLSMYQKYINSGELSEYGKTLKQWWNKRY